MLSFLFLTLFQFGFSSLFPALIWIKFSYPEWTCYFIHHLVVFSWTLLSLSLSSLCAVSCYHLRLPWTLWTCLWLFFWSQCLEAHLKQSYLGPLYWSFGLWGGHIVFFFSACAFKWGLAYRLSEVWYEFLARIQRQGCRLKLAVEECWWGREKKGELRLGSPVWARSLE